MPRYVHEIEVPGDGGAWRNTGLAGADDHDGTAASYGRDVLDRYLEESALAAARVLVWFAADDGGPAGGARNPVAVIDSPWPVTPEVADVERDREQVLRDRITSARHADALICSLRAARRAGYSANWLAGLASPAMSRPPVLAAVRGYGPDDPPAAHPDKAAAGQEG